MKKEKTYTPLVDPAPVLEVLDRISVFAGLDDKQLYSVFQKLTETVYSENELIFEQGDPPSHLYIIRKGKVRMYIESEKLPLQLMEFSVGNCFGETAVIGIQPHTASAVSVERSEIIVLSRPAFFSFYNSDTSLFAMMTLNIAREACRRLNKTDDILLHYYLLKNSGIKYSD